MEFDQFGFPKPANFVEQPRNSRPNNRVPTFFFVIAIFVAAGTAIGLNNWPQIQAIFRNVRRDGNMFLLAEQQRQLQIELNRGDRASAIRTATKMLQIIPNNIPLRHLRASLLADSQRYDDAIADCNAVLRFDPRDATALNNRAYFRSLARQDLAAAMQDVELALEIEPNNPNFLDTRGYLSYLSGRFAEALQDFNQVLSDKDYLETNANEAGEIFFHRGLVFRQQKKIDKANADFAEARRRGFQVNQFPNPMTQ